jgi:hypothetical protein
LVTVRISVMASAQIHWSPPIHDDMISAPAVASTGMTSTQNHQ